MNSKKRPVSTNSRQEELNQTLTESMATVKPNLFREILKWGAIVLLAVIVALLLRTFVFEWVVVQGASMEDTLKNEQVLFVNKLQYLLFEPERGDIVIIEISEGSWDYLYFAKDFRALTTLFPGKGEVNYIKRILGLPGDSIEIKDGHLYVNGNKQDEEYAKGLTYEQSFDLPREVPPNSVFVMGDNREFSKDSRQIGFIEYKKIKGKAVFRIKPLDQFGSIYN
ncbi:MAG: signal peptidase I [Clostridium sp.]|nr:signal peptidase I [Clostridium sp.]